MKKIFILVPILIIVLGAGYLVWQKQSNQVVQNPKKEVAVNPSVNNTTTQPVVSSQPGKNSGKEALDKNYVGVDDIKMNYTPTTNRYIFSGKYVSLENKGQDQLVILDPSGESTPAFKFTAETTTARIDASGAVIPMKLSEIKKGTVIDLIVDFEKDHKVWLLRNIYLIDQKNTQK